MKTSKDKMRELDELRETAKCQAVLKIEKIKMIEKTILAMTEELSHEDRYRLFSKLENNAKKPFVATQTNSELALWMHIANLSSNLYGGNEK